MHLTSTAGVGEWAVRHKAVGVIALPAEHRGDKARCAVDGSLMAQARQVVRPLTKVSQRVAGFPKPDRQVSTHKELFLQALFNSTYRINAIFAIRN